MSQQTAASEWPVLAADDGPLDLSREERAFEHARERLVAEHLGRLALIHEDEVVGVFDTVDDALREAVSRFGLARFVIREITPSDPPEFIPLADVNHPSFERVD